MTPKWPWHTLGTLLVGSLAYWMYYLYVTALPRWMDWVEWTGIPWISLAVGVFVGCRIRMRGWAFATVPLLLFLAPLAVAFGRREPPTLWPFLLYKLPVGLLVSMLGGFIGEHLTRSE